MTDPMERAEDLQLDACLDEVSGHGPSEDLAERTLAAVRAASDLSIDGDEQPARARWWLAAGLAAFGLGVVGAVSLLQEDDTADSAASQQVEAESTEPQDPVIVQDPEEKKAAAAIARLIRDLELSARRPTAEKALRAIGAPAVPALRHALEVEEQRGRAEVIAALRRTLGSISLVDAKKAAGLPGEGQVTLIADYSDNRLVFVDAKGKPLKVIDEIYGAWDVELLATGNVLVTEFSVSRVSEFDPKGRRSGPYTKLRNPYDADRLSNGNTLICDTFHGRVIEVNPKGLGRRQGRVEVRQGHPAVRRRPAGQRQHADRRRAEGPRARGVAGG